MLSGPAACRVYDAAPAQCALAWATTQGGGQPVTCFYSPSTATCQGCGPTNQTSGACVNTCASVAKSVPALSVGAMAAFSGLLLGFGVMASRAQRVQS